LGYWDIGVLGYWDIGTLGYWGHKPLHIVSLFERMWRVVCFALIILITISNTKALDRLNLLSTQREEIDSESCSCVSNLDCKYQDENNGDRQDMLSHSEDYLTSSSNIIDNTANPSLLSSLSQTISVYTQFFAKFFHKYQYTLMSVVPGGKLAFHSLKEITSMMRKQRKMKKKSLKDKNRV
jgi:hypothetical protein